MNLLKKIGFFIVSILSFAFLACEDNTTTIGSSITGGEVSITTDTLIFDLKGKPIEINTYDSKTGNLMIGRIYNESYGSLDCSFVTKLMCSPNLQVADSLLNPERVDSCKLVLGALRSEITGDSLAPQRLTIFTLEKPLPSDLNNTFNPEGYYNPQKPFASRSYTVSGIAGKDSAFYENSYVELSVDLPTEFGKEIFRKYKDEPEIFEWPQTMAEKFPLYGLYAKPTFGNGCIANITTAYVAVFFYNLAENTTVSDNDTIMTVEHVNNVVFPFTISPEVLSSNNLNYRPSEKVITKNELGTGEVVITTPGGYIASLEFPAEQLIDQYSSKQSHLTTINELGLSIPAEAFDASSGIGVASNVLLLKASEYDNFFNNNKVPDNVSSFTGVYDAENNQYVFSSMRSYFLELLQKGNISKEDTDFLLVPVELTTEVEVNSYYGTSSTYVTKCVPYTVKPTMTLLKLNEATVTFSFSTQVID